MKLGYAKFKLKRKLKKEISKLKKYIKKIEIIQKKQVDKKLTIEQIYKKKLHNLLRVLQFCNDKGYTDKLDWKNHNIPVLKLASEFAVVSNKYYHKLRKNYILNFNEEYGEIKDGAVQS